MDLNVALSPTEVGSRSVVRKVYMWMCAGLALTGWIAFYVGNNTGLLQLLIGNTILFYGLIIGEFALVIGLTAGINRMTAGAATMAFLVYAAFNGVTTSVIFLAYTASSIASTFFITAGTFGVMSLYGALTKRDLTSLGNICFMALIGIVIATLVNIFMRSTVLVWITTYIGILVFSGLTAYDTQKIKRLGSMDLDEEMTTKAAVMGALALYLDFINLFLMILRLTGRRK